MGAQLFHPVAILEKVLTQALGLAGLTLARGDPYRILAVRMTVLHLAGALGGLDRVRSVNIRNVPWMELGRCILWIRVPKIVEH